MHSRPAAPSFGPCTPPRGRAHGAPCAWAHHGVHGEPHCVSTAGRSPRSAPAVHTGAQPCTGRTVCTGASRCARRAALWIDYGTYRLRDAARGIDCGTQPALGTGRAHRSPAVHGARRVHGRPTVCTRGTRPGSADDEGAAAGAVAARQQVLVHRTLLATATRRGDRPPPRGGASRTPGPLRQRDGSSTTARQDGGGVQVHRGSRRVRVDCGPVGLRTFIVTRPQYVAARSRDHAHARGPSWTRRSPAARITRPS